MTRAMRAAAIVGLGGAAVLVSGCDPEQDAEADASPVPTATLVADVDAVAPADDPDLRDLLAEFEPEIDGFELFGEGYSPVDSADAYYGAFIEEVEPVECLAVYRGLVLGTPDDLGSAGGDLINPAGPYIVEGSSTNLVEESGPSMFIETRVFGDAGLAATMREDLVATECTEFTSTWVGEDDGGSTDRVDSIDEVSLEGLREPSVRVAIVDAAAPTDLGIVYVHVSGSYAIAVASYGLEDDPDLAAGVIAEFLAVMGAA